MAPKRAQSDGPYGPGPPFIPGVSYSVEELTAASEDQEARNERARKQFLDRSLRGARPTPPATPPRSTATTPETTMPTAPDAAESDVHATGSSVPAEAPEMTYMQQALSILQAPFRANKKRGHSGSSSEDQNMEGNIGESTAEPTTAEDESSKRPKIESVPDWYKNNQQVSKAWNERQDRLYKEQAEKRAAEQQETAKRLPDKLPVARNAAVLFEDTASQSQGSHDTAGGSGSGAKFHCPCCTGWFFTPQKRYLHLALQHTVLLPQLGGKMQDDFASEGLFVIPLLQPPTIRGGPRVFAGNREATAFRTAVKNASKIVNLADRCKLWQGGRLPDHWETDPPTLQLAEFWGQDSIKLRHTGEIRENRDLRSGYRTDHGKLNSWERYQQSKMEWGDRSADGDWADPDPRDLRYWPSQPYQSPFGGKGKRNTAGDGYGGEWIERPHYSNWTYRPNEKGDGKGEKGEDTARDPADPTDEHAADQPPRQEARGSHT
eukprot:6144909-Amphidinium_carterae.2